MDVIKNIAPKTEGDLIAYEFDQIWTRKYGVALAGSGSARVFAQFCLLGLISVGALSVAQAYAGTGNGTLGTLAVAAGTKPGVWKAVCVEPVTNLGTFILEDPDGNERGTIITGSAFNIGGISGTIADGATDFVAGDTFTLTVTAAAGSGKLKPWDPAATDGTQNVGGVNLKAFSAPDGFDADFEYLENGPAILKAESIAWPVGVTDPQKAAAIVQLRALGFKVNVK